MIDCEKCTKITEFEKQTGHLSESYIPRVCLKCLVNAINEIEKKVEAVSKQLKAPPKPIVKPKVVKPVSG